MLGSDWRLVQKIAEVHEGMADKTSAKLTDDTDILEKGKMSIQQPQTTHMAELTSDSDIIGAARELCRAGGALVAAARDEGTAAELEAMFAALRQRRRSFPGGLIAIDATNGITVRVSGETSRHSAGNLLYG